MFYLLASSRNSYKSERVVVRCTSRRFCWWPSYPAPSSAPRSTVASGCHQTWSPSWRRRTQCEQSAMTTNHRHLASTFSTFFTEASSVVKLPWDARQRRSCTSKFVNKKLSYRRGTARCVVSIEILPIATQQCRNYLYDKSWPNRNAQER